jgi:hypothetical protein
MCKEQGSRLKLHGAKSKKQGKEY